MAKISQAEFSRLMGVSRKTVKKWKSEGKIVMDGVLVDAEASRARLEKFTGRRGVVHQDGRVTGNAALIDGNTAALLLLAPQDGQATV